MVGLITIYNKMKLYLKNKQGEIKPFDTSEVFQLEEKLKDPNADSLNLHYNTLSKNIRSEWAIASEEEMNALLLEEEKEVKIKEIDRETDKLIFAKYRITDQLNILASGDNVAIADMNAVITEIRNKGKEAKSKIIN